MKKTKISKLAFPKAPVAIGDRALAKVTGGGIAPCVLDPCVRPSTVNPCWNPVLIVPCVRPR